jgi:hypothetical protein
MQANFNCLMEKIFSIFKEPLKNLLQELKLDHDMFLMGMKIAYVSRVNFVLIKLLNVSILIDFFINERGGIRTQGKRSVTYV